MTTSVTITPARPDSAEAQALIAELEGELAPFYPSESRHGYSVEKLLARGVAFILLRVDGAWKVLSLSWEDEREGLAAPVQGTASISTT